MTDIEPLRVWSNWFGKIHVDFECPKCTRILTSDEAEMGEPDFCPACGASFTLDRQVLDETRNNRKRKAEQRLGDNRNSEYGIFRFLRIAYVVAVLSTAIAVLVISFFYGMNTDHSAVSNDTDFRQSEHATFPQRIETSQPRSAYEKSEINKTWDQIHRNRSNTDRAVAETSIFCRVDNNLEAPKLEAILKFAGWDHPTVTEGVRESTEEEYVWKLEVIDGYSQDWYVTMRTDKDIRSGTVVSKSRGSPW